MATITKRDLVIKLSEESGLTQQQVLDLLQNFLDTVTDHLAEGNQVVLRNFGAFQVKRTKPKIGKEMKDRVSETMPSVL